MRRLSMGAVPVALALVLAACSNGGSKGRSGDARPSAPPKSEVSQGGQAAVPFKEARLIVETNATDGDAGLQVFLDHEPWKSISISRPDGTKILDVMTQGVLAGYGLTELFSESSEPPFAKFPLQEFQKLFPKGDYTFTGETIDGVKMQSTVTLSHDFPAGPKILSPKEDSTVAPSGLMVRWAPVTEPAGIKIVRYQVTVEKDVEKAKVKERPRMFLADLPATATQVSIPAEFMEPGATFKLEVLAIEVGGNQTLTEMDFNTG